MAHRLQRAPPTHDPRRNDPGGVPKNLQTTRPTASSGPMIGATSLRAGQIRGIKCRCDGRYLIARRDQSGRRWSGVAYVSGFVRRICRLRTHCRVACNERGRDRAIKWRSRRPGTWYCVPRPNKWIRSGFSIRLRLNRFHLDVLDTGSSRGGVSGLRRHHDIRIRGRRRQN
jgi:hypothetical protein